MEAYNLLVASDLHLGEGFDPESGKYSRMEDFLFDDAFARFLRYHESVRQQPRFGGRPWKLVFNGDLFDFVQVASLPQEGKPLSEVKGVASHAGLSADEQKYGLGTTARESAWKIERIARGHQRFFAALGRFVAHGNHVVVITGNHDIELYWPDVRERLVAEVERAYAREREMTGEGPSISLAEVKARVHFCPWFYYEPGCIYIEHGGQYESSSHFSDFLSPISPGDPPDIQVLWGRLFGRYLFNQVESVHPFADNFKPPTRYILWVFRKAPLMTLRLVVGRGWIFLRAFWGLRRSKSQQRESSCETLLPSEVTRKIEALGEKWSGGSRQEWFGTLILGALDLLTIGLAVVGAANLVGRSWLAAGAWLAAAAIAYLLRRFASHRVPTFDDFLLRVAQDLEQALKPTHPVPYIVLGHDHMAAMERLEDAWYVNTGAWVQIFEQKGPIEGREKLTFFRLAWGYTGVPELLRWDDAAGEPARLRFGLDD